MIKFRQTAGGNQDQKIVSWGKQRNLSTNRQVDLELRSDAFGAFAKSKGGTYVTTELVDHAKWILVTLSDIAYGFGSQIAGACR